MQRLGIEQATQKIKAFCAYQERCHYEVKEKLYGFGLYGKQVDEILALLITENYLNEERFARHFAGGRFRMKGWGRIKIANELKFKKVSPYLIKTALQEIDEDAYLQTLEKLAVKKWQSLPSEPLFVRQGKTIRYLLQKGFENQLVKEVVERIKTPE